MFAFRVFITCINYDAELTSSSAVWDPGTMFVAELKIVIGVSPYPTLVNHKSTSAMRSSDSTVSRNTASIGPTQNHGCFLI